MYNCDASNDCYPAQPFPGDVAALGGIHMPKKAHGRQAKQRPRNRRPASPTPTAAPGYDEGAVGVASAPVAPAVTAPRTAPATARPVARGGAARRAPTITVNYAYLRRDLMALGVLGPAMVVLLIVAYLVFHGA